ncbi:MAG: glycosyltransferase family 9 protein [Planctomycetaceae bacterium]|nr:glycosyltransferase family 9 protein [Planctomycetaceae bacterium]
MPVGRYRYTRLRWRILVRALDSVGSVALRCWRWVRPARRVEAPRRIVVVQLDHLGDAVLTSPMLERLRAAYPGATIDVLASPSNREVFEADPRVDRVRIATRSWFERRRGRWAVASAVWELGRVLRGGGYDLGIDVRGDILTVLVLALAGIPRRVGWAMGGGGFLLTDVADWVPGRHEVVSRLALLDRLGLPADGPARVVVPVKDSDRILVGQWLREAWPERPQRASGAIARARRKVAIGGRATTRPAPSGPILLDEPDGRDIGRFGASAPLLAVHLGAGTAAKRWPPAHWKALIGQYLDDGWRVVVVGGPEDFEAASGLAPHAGLRDWTGRMTVPQTAALLERADLFIGSDSGPAHLAACAGIASVVLFSGTNQSRQWRPWSRRSLVLRHHVPCRPCHQKVCPLADHPCMAGLRPDRVSRAARRWWARLHREESPHAPLEKTLRDHSGPHTPQLICERDDIDGSPPSPLAGLRERCFFQPDTR